jgi:hypothetical protein
VDDGRKERERARARERERERENLLREFIRRVRADRKEHAASARARKRVHVWQWRLFMSVPCSGFRV